MRTTGRIVMIAALAAAVLAVHCPPSSPPSGPIRVGGIMSPVTIPLRTRVQFNAYADSFTFDTTAGYGDRQKLSSPPSYVNTGPLADIEPESTAYDADSSALYAGRIIARILVTSTTAPYHKYSLHAAGDTTYWFVYHNQSYFVPRDTSHTASTSAFHIGGGHGNWHESIARWYWDPADETAWVTCDKNRCCYAN